MAPTFIADLGYKVDTRPLKKGEKALNDVTSSGKKTESQNESVSKSFASIAKTTALMTTSIVASAAAVATYIYKLGAMERDLQANALLAGTTANEFEKMAFVYKQFGLTIDQVNDIYKDSRERVGEWKKAQTGALQDFGDVMDWSKGKITEFANSVDGLTGQQLLQRMVIEMESAGATANEMSFALEGMASEATRMIPALTDNGKAITSLADDYDTFNSSFALDKQEIQNYKDLTKEFDLFLDTAENGMTKVLAPLAGHMAALANATSHFLSSLQQGSESQLTDELVMLSDRAKLVREAIKNNQTLAGQAKNLTLNYIEGFSSSDLIDTELMSKELERIQSQALSIRERLSELRTGTGGLIDTSKPLEIMIKPVISTIASNSTSKEVAKTIASKIEIEMDSIAIPDDIGFDIIADNAMKGLSAIQDLSAQGSKEYQKLGKAIQAVSAIQATAAAVASATTGNIIGAVSSGLTLLSMLSGDLGADDWIKNQENQGLNVWGDKSESIANATDITANAVEKLVGINSDMLKALQTVQNGISKAASLALRDTNIPQINTGSLVNENPLSFITDNSFSGLFGSNFLTEALDFLTGNFIFEAIGKFLGGSSKVTDEGIRIIGGSLGEMMDDITVLAFQSVKYKKWKFGSSKSKTQYNDITDEVGSQFQLVLNSIADSVFLGATGLGLDSAAVEKAIQDFQIESFNISLLGLSAEDQQKEVEAAFGKIFDDLAGDVIPFLDKFQQVGEGLGETLARVSTQVSIMDLMVDQLGVTMFDKMANPEMYAQAADNISTLVGGIEEFADKTSGFVNNFATEATKIDIYQKSLTNSFNEVGLTLPGTAAGMWELMASLDGSTEAGQEQIAMLLNSQEQAAAYFDLIEKTTKAYRDAIDSMYGVSDAVAQMSLDAALAAARMGDFSLAEQLSTNSLAPSMSSFGTRSEYELARAQTAAKLEELAQLTEGTISVDEKQLTTLEQIRDTIKDNGTIENTAAISELKKEVQAMNAVQVGQARNAADSNALLQQIVIDGIPVRVEE